MSIAQMVSAAEAIDKANTGYDQSQRWSFFDRNTKRIIPNGEGDCSSVCGAIAVLGGYPVNLADPFYTGTFKERLEAAGFTAIRFNSLDQLRVGDFVLNTIYHVEFVPYPGTMFSANIDERGNAVGGAAGDQNSREVYFKKAYLYWAGWNWILRPPAEANTGLTLNQVAREVVAGKWGNGAARTANLAAAGYDPAAVQAEVNRIVFGLSRSISEIAAEVIQGQWGNGAERVNRLRNAGYDPTAVQLEVNKQLAQKDLEAIAREVVAGRWGNGADRISRLSKEGYDPNKVQAEVNRILRG